VWSNRQQLVRGSGLFLCPSFSDHDHVNFSLLSPVSCKPQLGLTLRALAALGGRKVKAMHVALCTPCCMFGGYFYVLIACSHAATIAARVTVF
jgi:hypothetical protein